jgi:hypothetical protein
MFKFPIPPSVLALMPPAAAVKMAVVSALQKSARALFDIVSISVVINLLRQLQYICFAGPSTI